MCRLQVKGLDAGLPVFQQELYNSFVFIRIKGAGGIDQGPPRPQKIKGPEKKVSLKGGQPFVKLGGASKKVIAAGTKLPLGSAWDIHQHPVKSEGLGQVLTSIARGNGICDPQTLAVGLQSNQAIYISVIGHNDTLIAHELGEQSGFAARCGTDIKHNIIGFSEKLDKPCRQCNGEGRAVTYII